MFLSKKTQCEQARWSASTFFYHLVEAIYGEHGGSRADGSQTGVGAPRDGPYSVGSKNRANTGSHVVLQDSKIRNKTLGRVQT